jgi:hypothetical protein
VLIVKKSFKFTSTNRQEKFIARFRVKTNRMRKIKNICAKRAKKRSFPNHQEKTGNISIVVKNVLLSACKTEKQENASCVVNR